MFMRRSTLAVTFVIALSAAAGATQVFAFSDDDAPALGVALDAGSAQPLDQTVALVDKAH